MADCQGKPKSGSYSIWAVIPHHDEELHSIMKILREQHNGPEFPPHVTILVQPFSTEDDAVNSLKALCESSPPLRLRVVKVDKGNTYHQCVFLLMDKTDEVVYAHIRALRCFKQISEEDSIHEIRQKYKPHLSLLYNHMTDEELDAVCAKVAAEHEKDLVGKEYKITHLTLYSTDASDESCDSWVKIAEFPLKG